MTEIPEHLRKRAEEARRKAQERGGGADEPAAPAPAASAEGAADAPAAAGEQPVASEAASRIPAHLLERSRAAKARSEGPAPGDGGAGTGTAAGSTVPAATATATAGSVATAAPPIAAGPGGHTQRLLTVVKSGSIQDVKAAPVDKVHVWPHLLVIEFVACLAATAFLLVFGALVQAPLQVLANQNQTPNPSKAPWYFLGLQELLTMFHPMVAGVTIPAVGLLGLIIVPYTDRNPSNRPEDRKFAIALMTFFLMFWAVITIIGIFFRGPGFNFTFPWREGLFFEL
ncbi:MAG: menaquinol-cytochrome c reductase cytochrome b subunit [Acidimicrobiia bacterium]